VRKDQVFANGARGEYSPFSSAGKETSRSRIRHPTPGKGRGQGHRERWTYLRKGKKKNKSKGFLKRKGRRGNIVIDGCDWKGEKEKKTGGGEKSAIGQKKKRKKAHQVADLSKKNRRGRK